MSSYKEVVSEEARALTLAFELDLTWVKKASRSTQHHAF